MDTLIDLYSDTATRPSAGMRAAIASATVGDEQKGEDPTVNALQERVAALLNAEAALYVPSATMANAIAVKIHTRPGDEVILDASAHILQAEAGGPAVLAGVLLHPVAGDRGVFTDEQVVESIRRDAPNYPRTRLVCVEQTTNLGGGRVWSVASLRSMAETAHRHHLRTHMDGARLMNAVVALGIPASEQAQGYDSITFCLTKGLGCPVGALVAGPREFITEARRYKQMFGGGMRQAGIIAAAGLYALDHNVDRLAEDHANAQIFARGIADIPGVAINVAHVESNLVFFDVSGTGLMATDVVARLLARGVRVGAQGLTRVRAVTHLDVSRAEVERAVSIAQEVLAKPRTAATRE